MKSHKAGLFALGLILATALVTGAWAQDQEEVGKRDIIQSRTYVGFFGTSATIDQWGFFQGTHAFGAVNGSASVEVDIIPSITRNFGVGGLLGYREGPWAVELSFARSDHTALYTGGSSVTISNPASLCSIDIDFKRYFLTTLPVQPFVSMGMALPWLWVRQGSYLYDSSSNLISNDDETISGIGLNLGTGLDIYISQDVCLMAQVYQRWTGFDQISGASKIPYNQMTLDGVSTDVGAIEGDGMHIRVGTTLGFQM